MKLTKPKFLLPTFLILASLAFLSLSLIEFSLGRQKFLQSGPALDPNISIISLSPHSQTPYAYEISWKITAPTPRSVSATTIYYDTDSTPSALTASDPPSSPGYHYLLSDYLSGPFTTPTTFTATLYPPLSATTVFLRAYAHIDKLHYWTAEYTINLKP